MKSAPFSYARPTRLHEALQLLADHGDEARLLAGGQTLLATLNMRLSEPSLLIDLQAIDELKSLRVDGASLRIGAMATHTEIAESKLVAEHAPLLTAAAPHIAHRAIRNLGTFGGSIAYGDPAAEWPACLLALGGVVLAASLRGERRIAADDFFTGLYTTALAADEIIVACELPLAAPSQKFSFAELARRHGDYAAAGLATLATFNNGSITQVRLAWIAMGSVPMRSPAAELALATQALSADSVNRAVEALQGELNPLADLTHSAAAKKHLAGVLLRRALTGWMTPADPAQRGAAGIRSV